ncbi:MAG: hypothetical protein QM811_19750 [Pirellulales bacterium]
MRKTPRHILERRALNLAEMHRRIVLEPYRAERFPIDRAVVTFRPGDFTANFRGKRFLPVGQAVMVQQRYVVGETADGDRIELTGYRRSETADGWREYCDDAPLFSYDGLLEPQVNAQGERLDQQRNPSLVELLCFMHKRTLECDSPLSLSTSVALPTVVVGFAPGARPAFQETPELRHIAGELLRVKPGKLACYDSSTLRSYLERLWNEQWIPKDEPTNNTGLDLIEVGLCPQARHGVAKFEDFQPLLGLRLDNPCRYFLRDRPDLDRDACDTPAIHHLLHGRITKYHRNAVTIPDIIQAVRNPNDFFDCQRRLQAPNSLDRPLRRGGGVMLVLFSIQSVDLWRYFRI